MTVTTIITMLKMSVTVSDSAVLTILKLLPRLTTTSVWKSQRRWKQWKQILWPTCPRATIRLSSSLSLGFHLQDCLIHTSFFHIFNFHIFMHTVMLSFHHYLSICADNKTTILAVMMMTMMMIAMNLAILAASPLSSLEFTIQLSLFPWNPIRLSDLSSGVRATDKLSEYLQMID